MRPFKRTLFKDLPWNWLFACTLMVSAVIGAPAYGEASDAAKRGKVVIDKWCAGCHVTGATQQRKAVDLAPTLPEIAKAPQTTAVRLRALLASPHAKMPTGVLSTREIEDVIAYILSLRK